eukprot:1160138-Pelagomonas_calceolata.AAC.5
MRVCVHWLQCAAGGAAKGMAAMPAGQMRTQKHVRKRASYTFCPQLAFTHIKHCGPFAAQPQCALQFNSKTHTHTHSPPLAAPLPLPGTPTTGKAEGFRVVWVVGRGAGLATLLRAYVWRDGSHSSCKACQAGERRIQKKLGGDGHREDKKGK